MTKIVAVLGSPNKTKGYSGRMVKQVLAGARDLGAKTEIIPIYDYTIEPCRGCFVCSKHGKCVIDDDYLKVADAWIDSDGYLLATPNYMNGVTGQIKTLFDRSFSYLYHLQKLKGKHAVTVVSSGGPEFDAVQAYFSNILEMMGTWKVGSVAASEGQFEDEDEAKDIEESLFELGKRLVTAIENRNTYEDQEGKMALYYAAIEYLVVAQKPRLAYENKYWKEHFGLQED